MRRYKDTKYYVSEDGKVFSMKRDTFRELRGGYNNVGYRQVCLVDPVKRWHKVHRLVAELYIPNPDNKPEVNHINGDKTDNRASNLQWCTRAENQQHGHRLGLWPGFRVPNIQTRIIIRLLESANMTMIEIGDVFGISQPRISKIKSLYMGKACKNCGEIFKYQISGYKEYCGFNCYNNYRYHSKVDHEERTCLWCGKEWLVHKQRSDSKCCSTSCGVKHSHMQKQVPKDMEQWHNDMATQIEQETNGELLKELRKEHKQIVHELKSRYYNQKRFLY